MLLRILALWVLSGLLFVAGVGPLRARHVVFWAVQVTGDLLTATLARAVARVAVRREDRRFWTSVVVAECCFAVSDVTKLALTAFRPGEDLNYHRGQAVFVVAGYLAILASTTSYPTGMRTPKERLRFWLDASAAVAGTGVFVWCLLISPVVDRDRANHLVEGLLSGGAVLLIGFGVVKLLLSAATPITRLAMGVVLLAVGLQSGADALLGGSAGWWDTLLLVLRAFTVLLLATVPRIHLLQTGGAPVPRRRRRYSMLPYGTMVAVFALLCAQVDPGDLRPAVLGALAGVAVIAGLVVVRQLSAFGENAELLDRLAYQTSHDPLTGLANRTAFTERLAAALPHPPVTAVLIDLDGFKQVNDTLGHHAGDLMLVEVAARLRASVRAGDTVARLGGDEFAMLLPGADAAAATAVVERFFAALEPPADIEGHLLPVRASAGAAVGHDDDPDLLLRAADAAMYRVKHGGKGAYAVVPARGEAATAPGRPAAAR